MPEMREPRPGGHGSARLSLDAGLVEIVQPSRAGNETERLLIQRSAPHDQKARGHRPQRFLRDIEPRERFGRLVVEGSIGGRQRYQCRCDCGNEVDVARANLLSGHTLSCGCLARQLAHDRLYKINRENGEAQRDRWSRRAQGACASPGCSHPAGHGMFACFCPEHAAQLARVRDEIKRGRWGFDREHSYETVSVEAA